MLQFKKIEDLLKKRSDIQKKLLYQFNILLNQLNEINNINEIYTDIMFEKSKNILH